MNLLRASSLLRLWRRIAVRRRAARAVYTVTVPAPLAGASVVELRRPVVVTRPAPLPRVVNG
ncbi:hypothetical protein [Frateuria sp. YIM B11624]|uniref:hypothetical protein n=1 Tax=Frateuria sp. YIM B11624 TaxID=3143185 RepID=UPI003C738520